MYLDPWQTLEEKERSNLADYGIVIFIASQCGRLWYTYIRAFINHVNYAWNDMYVLKWAQWYETDFDYVHRCICACLFNDVGHINVFVYEFGSMICWGVET